MDLAVLGLEIRVQGDRQVIRAMKGVEDQAGKTEKAAKGVAGSLDGLSRAFRLMAPLAGVVASAFSIRALVQYGDAWSDMQSRVGAAIKDMEAAPAMMQRLVAVANASYSPLQQTVEIYGRNVAVLRDLGRSATETADFTEALNHALVTTATKAQDADVVLNALSRAIAIGGLRSMEFETIMSRSPRVLEAVADEMGTTVTGLRALAQQGKVTGDVIVNSLVNSLERLREEAGEMPATVEDGIVRMQTNIGALMGRLDQALGATDAFAKSLIGLADSIAAATGPIIGVFTMIADEIERVLYWAGALALYWGGPYVAGVVAARIATLSLVGALTALRAIMIRTGVGAVVVLLGELAYQVMQTRTEVDELAGSFEETAVRGMSMGERLTLVGHSLDQALKGVAYGFEAAMLGAFASILSNFKGMILEMSEPINALLAAMGSVHRLSEEGMDWAITALENGARQSGIAMGYSFGRSGSFLSAALDFTSPEGDANAVGGEGGGSDPLGLGGAAGKLNAYQEAVKAVREGVQTLEQQALAFGLSETAATRFNTAMDLLRAAEQAKIPITGALIDQINGLADAYALAEERTRLLQQQQQLAVDINNTLASSFSSMFMGILDGSKNAMQAIGDLLKSLGQLLINQAFMSLFGAGTGGGIGGGIASFLFGGARADGGPVQAGMSYLVGERGPELFTAAQAGMITPNHALRSANANVASANDNRRGDINITINGSGLNEEQLARAIGDALASYDSQLVGKVENKMKRMQSDRRAPKGRW